MRPRISYFYKVKSRYIPLLTGLMGAALLGIIVLQVSQIHRALRLSEQQFMSRVKFALNDVAASLQKAEMQKGMLRVSEELNVSFRRTDSDSNANDSLVVINEQLLPPPPPPLPPHQDSLMYVRRNVIVTKPYTLIRDSSVVITEMPVPGGGSQGPGLQVMAPPRTIQMIVRSLSDMSSPMRIEDRLDPAVLDSLIREKLTAQGISLSYTYRVTAGSAQEVVFSNAPDPKDSTRSPHWVEIFPNPVFADRSLLFVSFPGQKRYSIRDIWLQALASFAFTALILICFSLTVRSLYEQKRLSDMKTGFINNMSHELKTPIATVSLAADALANPAIRNSDEAYIRYLRIIREENQRMNRQVERTLQSAQFERSSVELHKVPTDMHALIAQSAEAFELRIRERNGTLVIEPGADDATLMADPDFIRSVLFNLLDNADKYSPETPRIHISTQKDASALSVSIRDEGKGISRSEQAHIFDPFYRVPTGNLHEVKGFGLGLSHVREIVQAHGGSVRVASVPGAGSTFTFSLPA